MFTSYIVNFKKFDCCGSTGSQGFRDLVSNAGYGSVSGYQPYVCCHDYTQTNSLSSTHCDKKAGGGEFLSIVNHYSYGLIASMSITTVFEIICLIFSMYYLLRFLKQAQSEIKPWILELLKKFCSGKQLCGLACGVLKMMLSVGFLAESVALQYDEIFANKQIYFLLARVSMAGNSFTTNLVIFKWLMTTSGCLLLLDSIYSFLTIYKESKILHAINIVSCVLGISFVLSNLGFWIAVDVENFPRDLLSQVAYIYYNFYSGLHDGYRMDEQGAWNNLFILHIIILSRLIKSDLSLKEDPIILKMKIHPTTRRKLKNTLEEQRNENHDMSEVEEKEKNELSQISTTENLNGTAVEVNQDGKSEKIDKKKKRRGGKVKPMSDNPDPVQRPLSKLPPLQMQRKP